jgi:hypothetical protein
MTEEYNSHIDKNTWDLVPLPSYHKLVICKWIYNTKEEKGHVRRYKEILISKGF